MDRLVEMRWSNIMVMLMLMIALLCRSTLEYDKLDISGPAAQLTGRNDEGLM
jgi:hypothetical protein